MVRIKKGMSIEQVRQEWTARAEAKSKSIMDAYAKMRSGHGRGGREGLGVYGQYQSRVADAKVKLAVTLLTQAGIEVGLDTLHKVTGQSRDTLRNYWRPPAPVKVEPVEDDGHVPVIYQFPRMNPSES